MMYWQHETPLRCPRGHTMGWLGSMYWLCSTCRPKVIYVQQDPTAKRGGP